MQKMQRDMFTLIGNLCSQFKLSPEIEFTCYDSYGVYFENYFNELERFWRKKSSHYGNDANKSYLFIQRILNTVDKNLLLQTLALISICAKYVGGSQWRETFRTLPDWLQRNQNPNSYREILIAEFQVYRNLNFQIKPSFIYNVMERLVRKCSKAIDGISFDTFHGKCLKLLRLTYLERNEIYEFMNNNANINGKEGLLFGASVVLGAVTLVGLHREQMTKILDIVIVETKLNRHFLYGLSQSILNVTMQEMAV